MIWISEFPASSYTLVTRFDRRKGLFMSVRRLAMESCWFGAAIMGLAAYGFLLAWIDSLTGYDVSAARDALLMISAGAIVVMIILIVLTFCIEHQR
ncbi:MAG: hypothetical protein ACXWCY_14070 [Burkholderiales bacterium]